MGAAAAKVSLSGFVVMGLDSREPGFPGGQGVANDSGNDDDDDDD